MIVKFIKTIKLNTLQFTLSTNLRHELIGVGIGKTHHYLLLSRFIWGIAVPYFPVPSYCLTQPQTASKVHPGALGALKRCNLAICPNIMEFFVPFLTRVFLQAPWCIP